MILPHRVECAILSPGRKIVLFSRPKPAAEDRTRGLLELLYHVSREVATALDLRTVLQRVLYEAMSNVGGERASIVVLDDNGKPVESTIVHGQKFHEHTTQQMRETMERGLAGWVVNNRQPALIPDTSKDERWLMRPDDSADKTGAKSAICVPLLARERLVGVLTLVHSVPSAFNEEHLELMQAIADQAGVAVLNARLYTESQRQARVMTALAESAASINTSLRMEDVLQRILNQAMQAMQVETAAIALTEAQSGELVFRAATGQNAGNIINRRVPAGEGMIGRVAHEGRGLVIASVSEDKRFTEVDRFGGIHTKAVAAAPIQTQAGVIGVVEAINPISGAFDPDALLVMTGLGSLAGTTIQNATFYERIDAAQHRYRELFEDSIDPILITDWDGKILEANRQAVLLSGLTDEELRTQTIDSLHDINWERTGKHFESLRGEPANYESSMHQKEGGLVPVDVHVRRVELEQSDSLQWMLRDITERKELDALREDMASMIYHDLRSPLANIVSSIALLASMLDEKDTTERSVLGIASHSTARIQRLVDSLLDLNRLEAGQPVTDQKVADPMALVQLAFKDVAPAAQGRHQKLISSLPEHLPPLWVDTDMSHRVLVNLIENAIKFTPSEGSIEVGAKEDGEWLQFWVRDNGPGIPSADQEHIFEKFIRLREKSKSGGLGVGLAFCRLAVQGHGGRIWVESRHGKGATFRFTLPLATQKQIAASSTH
jgi:two-component system, NtrC family, sensor histidine kinase KinB